MIDDEKREYLQNVKNMDIVEFTEKVCGVKLPEWQKELLKKIEELPPDERRRRLFINIPPRCGKRLTRRMLEVTLDELNLSEGEKNDR